MGVERSSRFKSYAEGLYNQVLVEIDTYRGGQFGPETFQTWFSGWGRDMVKRGDAYYESCLPEHQAEIQELHDSARIELSTVLGEIDKKVEKRKKARYLWRQECRRKLLEYSSRLDN